jgi:hypothetical protein
MTVDLSGWLPFRLTWLEGRAVVDWCRGDGGRFHEPFFHDTLARLRRRPFNLLFRRPMPVQDLLDGHDSHSGIEPSGFIFHMSRCGSTLVSRMLAASFRNLVLSEPAPVDDVLRSRYREDPPAEESRIEWLRAMVSALGQPHDALQDRLFIKFDCWSIFELSLIRKAFPAVPAVFLYRNPLEVLVSHRRQPGMQMVPQFTPSRIFGLPDDAFVELGLDAYYARVLESILAEAEKAAGRQELALLNYGELPDAVWTSLSSTFRVSWDEREIETMHVASRIDAKNPRQEFREDRARKLAEASGRLREENERWLVPVYERLEVLRTKRA